MGSRRILGLERDASPATIKKTYRKLARKYHHDLNPDDPQAEERFKEVAAAHDVLADAKKRGLYDEFGEAGLKEGFDPDQARAYRDWQQRASASGGASRGGGAWSSAGGGQPFDLSDLFAGFQGGGRRSSRRRVAMDLEASVDVNLQEAVLGSERQLVLSRTDACSSCGGSGVEGRQPEETCARCGAPVVWTSARAPCRSTPRAGSAAAADVGPARPASRARGKVRSWARPSSR